jgi:dipeptidyl aminopeptidase/acylaminoacyl peptidase
MAPLRSFILPGILFAALLPCGGAAQNSTDIFVAELRHEDGVYRILEPRNATQRPGYDNQPWFLPDGSAFLYSSERDGQMDIFRYDLRRGSSQRITSTPENEYSPSLSADGRRMMVVRWPTDMSTGALWWFTPGGRAVGEATGSVPRVGYYAVADERTLALFINDSAQSFILSDTQTGAIKLAGEHMNGSGPRAIPRQRAVSFQQRGEDGAWWLVRLDMVTGERMRLVPMIGNVPNYAWTPDGAVLAAVGNTIHSWRPGQEEWRVVAAFDDPALQGITRIAITGAGDRVAFVSARPPEE